MRNLHYYQSYYYYALPEYDFKIKLTDLPIHLHVQGNAFRLLMLKD